MVWFVLFVVIVSNLILIGKHGIYGPIVAHIMAAIIWVFFPGYETGFAGLLLTDIVVVALAGFGALSGPPSVAKIGAAGVGGYLAGRWMARL